jgi:H+/Cl- antiporter ClcA
LHAIQHVAFDYRSGAFEGAVERASALRRVTVLTIAGAAAGFAWWALRRDGDPVSVNSALTGTRMPVVGSVLNATVQVFIVAAGASLGREGAPREIGASLGGWLSERAGLTPARRRVVIASGAGAGLAAVYNVPLGGTFFALEILLATAAPGAVIAAATVSGIATAVSLLVFGDKPTYFATTTHLGPLLLLTTLVLGPLAGLVGLGFRGLAARARPPTTLRGGRLVVALLAAFAALGGVAARYPQLLGNGKGPTQLVLVGALSLPTILILTVLKPLVTAACLRAGAVGGLLTPAVATGALLGGLAGGLVHQIAPSVPITGVAIVGAAAVLSVTQRAPITAIALLIEFTGGGVALVIPLLVGVFGAQATSAILSPRQRGPGRLEP